MEERGEVLIRENREDKEGIENQVLHYHEVLKELEKRGRKISKDRARRLFNTGKVWAEKIYHEGKRGYPWRWHSKVASFLDYFKSLKTPNEYGKMGGRGNKKVRKEGVVFEAQ